jgi:hypothetical protein
LQADALAVVSVGLLLVVVAVLRQEFIGDGIRHLRGAIDLARPPIGPPRWLLFPALAWLLVHPIAAVSRLFDVEAAIRLILTISVVAGLGYLWALNMWLRAERCDPPARAAALMLAGATAPFLILYSNIAEVQLPAAIAVAALAACRIRFVERRAGDRTVIATIAAIAFASLLYQAVFLAMLFVPLAAPMETLRRRRVWLSGLALIAAVPLLMVAARTAAGDPVAIAILTTLQGERGEIIRASLGRQSPLKWAAALIAGPPQALVGLWRFQGLSHLAAGLLSGDIDAFTNTARLAAGLAVTAALAAAVLRAGDWRIGVAAVGVLALPIFRNQQYTYVKFYLLWPVVVALASAKLRPARALSLALVVLALNSVLLAQDVREGRARFADAHRAYASATAGDCFLTTGWGPPFWHTWPGTSVPLISLFWASDEQTIARSDITRAVTDCFCHSARVWTDATSDSEQEVTRLASEFRYAALPLGDYLLRPEDSSAIATANVRMFLYSPERQAQVCRLIKDQQARLRPSASAGPP